MPTFPNVRSVPLNQAAKGSLISFSQDGVHFGLRVARIAQRKEEAAMLHLSVRGDTVHAYLVPSVSNNRWSVHGSTTVLDYSDNWRLDVEPAAWERYGAVRSFGDAEAGYLLLDAEGQFGLEVEDAEGAGCKFLNMQTWMIDGPNGNKYSAAKKWNLVMARLAGEIFWRLR